MDDKHIRRKRYREIISVFTKYGFRKGEFSGQKLRMAFEELGPTFIKLGQILSIRRDILPADITEELKKLQDSVKPFPFSDVKALIESEFNDNLENIFEEFDVEPLAAASLAQVHKARLITGKQVAVKVQRPDIERKINIDLDILKRLARFIDKRTKYGEIYDFSSMVADFEKTIKNELDFIKEGGNADIFLQNLCLDEGVTVPKAKWIYTTRRVLTMDYIKGIKISDLDALDHAGLDRRKLGEKLATSICNQILRDGFFHADPHPGNIHVLVDGTIVFLDLGMVGRLDEAHKEMISNFFIGVAFEDSRMVVNSIFDIDAISDRGGIKKFEKDIGSIIEKYLAMPMGEIQIDELMREMFNIAFLNHIKIPSEYTLVAKAMGTLQGVLESLAPDLNSIIIAEPIAKKMVFESFAPDKVKEKIKKAILNYRNLLNKLPDVLQSIIQKAEDEEFSVRLELKEMDDFLRRQERIFSRVSFSVVLVAISIVTAGALISLSLIAETSNGIYDLNLLILKACLLAAIVIIIGIITSVIKSRH